MKKDLLKARCDHCVLGERLGAHALEERTPDLFHGKQDVLAAAWKDPEQPDARRETSCKIARNRAISCIGACPRFRGFLEPTAKNLA